MALITLKSPDLAQTAKTVTKPLISVIIATKGDRTIFLEKCLKSLQQQTFQNFEIILVYSIFPRNLDSLLESSNLVAIKENGSTIAAARNLGVRSAKGDLIAFIDDDCEPLPDWLEKVNSIFMNSPLISCFGGPAIPPPEISSGNPLTPAQGSFSDSMMGKVRLNRTAVGKLSTSNIAYRRKIFEQIGYFSERYKSGEDFDFNMRLAEKGYSLIYDPKIFVWHHSAGGLKHAFIRSSEMVPFFLSLNTLRFAKYESIFASFYLTNLLSLILLAFLFISPIISLLIFLLALIGHFGFVVVSSSLNKKNIKYFPLTLLFTLARLFGFYYGLAVIVTQLASAH